MAPAGSLPDPATPAPSPAPADAEPVRQAHRQLLIAQWRRVLTKQKNSGHSDPQWARTLLLEPAAAYGSICGVPQLRIAEALSRTIERCAQLDLDPEEAHEMADLLIKEIGGNHHATA